MTKEQASIIERVAPAWKIPDRLLLVQETTEDIIFMTADSIVHPALEGLVKKRVATRAALNSWLSTQKKVAHLKGIQLGHGFEIVPYKELAAFMSPNYWESFYAKNPHWAGVLRFGYPFVDGNTGIVYVRQDWGSLQARGTLYVLAKHQNAWKITRTVAVAKPW